MAGWRSRDLRLGIKSAYAKPERGRLGALPCSASHTERLYGRRQNAHSSESSLHLWNPRPDPPSPDATDSAMPEFAADVLSVVHGLFQLDGLCAHCQAVCSDS
jgi:hypothetical protein